jgi:hypothetical protein
MRTSRATKGAGAERGDTGQGGDWVPAAAVSLLATRSRTTPKTRQRVLTQRLTVASTATVTKNPRRTPNLKTSLREAPLTAGFSALRTRARAAQPRKRVLAAHRLPANRPDSLPYPRLPNRLPDQLPPRLAGRLVATDLVAVDAQGERRIWRSLCGRSPSGSGTSSIAASRSFARWTAVSSTRRRIRVHLSCGRPQLLQFALREPDRTGGDVDDSESEI